ncbi:Uncharacterized protein ABFK01_2084 [Acinetobacter baumannii]|nr:Uncharacterised protein [Acinetobacter baumannii]SSQ71421.1 Uncharacterised protein [Acinetobacter baumannii]
MAMNKTMAPIAIESVPVNKIRKFVDFLSVNIPTAPERASAINIIPFSHADDVWKIFASKDGISDRKKPLTIQSAMLIGLILNKALFVCGGMAILGFNEASAPDLLCAVSGVRKLKMSSQIRRKHKNSKTSCKGWAENCKIEQVRKIPTAIPIIGAILLISEP